MRARRSRDSCAAGVLNHFTGQSLIAVPGVNALSELEATLVEYKRRGLMEIETCFDMDYLRNHNVDHAYMKLLSLIKKLDIPCKTCLWNPVFNGMDDYLKSKNSDTSKV